MTRSSDRQANLHYNNDDRTWWLKLINFQIIAVDSFIVQRNH